MENNARPRSTLPPLPETTYTLDTWAPTELALVSPELDRLSIAHHWEGTTLVINESDEVFVDALLDRIEAALPPSTIPTTTAPSTSSDPWFPHFLRFLCIWVLLAIGQVILIGVIWQAAILRRTGYRARDLLLLLVPIYGGVVSVVTLWRYTARSVYWDTRAGRNSAVLQESRQLLIGLGAAAMVLIGPLAAAVALAAPQEPAASPWWDAATEKDWIDSFVDNGWDRVQASCVIGYLEEVFPEGMDGQSSARVTLAIRRALNGPCDR